MTALHVVSLNEGVEELIIFFSVFSLSFIYYNFICTYSTSFRRVFLRL